MTYDNLGDIPVDELRHYGVKGMKWGVRRGADGVRPIARTLDKSKFGKAANKNAERHMKAQTRKSVAKGAKSKISAAVDHMNRAVAEKDASIETARNTVGDKATAYSAARRKYKQDKVTMGRKEAKKLLAPVREDFVSTLLTASEKTYGEKVVDSLFSPNGSAFSRYKSDW